MDAPEVESWLTKINKTRMWLAEQCNVSPNTVKGWLSAGKPITGAAEALIQRLMEDERRIDPEFSLTEWMQIEARAEAEGVTPQVWISRVLKREIAKPDAPPVNSSGAIVPTAASSKPYNIAPMSPQHLAAEDAAEYVTPKKAKDSSSSGGPKKKAK